MGKNIIDGKYYRKPSMNSGMVAICDHCKELKHIHCKRLCRKCYNNLDYHKNKDNRNHMYPTPEYQRNWRKLHPEANALACKKWRKKQKKTA